MKVVLPAATWAGAALNENSLGLPIRTATFVAAAGAVVAGVVGAVVAVASLVLGAVVTALGVEVLEAALSELPPQAATVSDSAARPAVAVTRVRWRRMSDSSI